MFGGYGWDEDDDYDNDNSDDEDITRTVGFGDTGYSFFAKAVTGDENTETIASPASSTIPVTSYAIIKQRVTMALEASSPNAVDRFEDKFEFTSK
jgi:hypothetical protein